jgi:hypothetical protein
MGLVLKDGNGTSKTVTTTLENSEHIPHSVSRPELEQEILDGKIFQVLTSAAVANGTSLSITFNAGATDKLFNFLANFTVETKVEFIEGGSIAGGTPLTPFNKDFTSANTTDGVLTAGTTVTGGTVVADITYGDGNKAGGLFENQGYVFGAGNDYTLRVTSNAVGNTVSVETFWRDL